MSTAVSRTGAPFPLKFRRKYSRSNSGCFCCRRRRKKCDERRPVCTNCAKRLEVCEWPPSEVIYINDSAVGSLEDDTSARHMRSAKGDALLQNQQPEKKGRVARKAQAPMSSTDRSTFQAQKMSSQTRGQALLVHSPSQLVGAAGLLRDSQARLLFDHYVTETAPQLGTMPQADTPFVTCLLPLALSDDLIMHSLIALSGAHLCHEKTWDSQIDVTTCSHYAIIIRQVREAFTESQPVNTIRLLAATLMLCTFEAVSGNTDGAIFHHLKASGQLIRLALSDSKHEDKELLEFLLELYAYFVFVGHVTTNSISQDRVIPFDPSITSLVSTQCSKTSGIMFGCAQELFNLIPSISILGRQRFLEDGYGECSAERLHAYKTLRQRILEWQPPLAIRAASKTYTEDHLMAASIYQHSLLIFLCSSFHGSHIIDSDGITEVEDSISIVLSLLWHLSYNSNQSSLLSVMMWPILITGSCLRDPRLQANLRTELLESKVTMSIVTRAVQLLDCLWEDQDQLAYGPIGLEVAMQKHGLNLCMS